MWTNIDSLVNQPYHHNNTSDHIVNDNLGSPLLDPSWITSLRTFCCCNIPVEMSHLLPHEHWGCRQLTGHIGWNWSKTIKAQDKILIQAMSTTQNLEVILSLYGITHLDMVSETRKYFLVQVCDSYLCCAQTFWASRKRNEIPFSEYLL